MKIYPNPTTNDLYINSNELILKITVFDLKGSQVKTIQQGTGILSVMDIPPGLYLLKIDFAKSTINTKFIKEWQMRFIF